MERPFDGYRGLYNHVTPNVSDEALLTRLQQIVEFVDEVKPTAEEVADFQREVDHISWELKMRKLAKKALEEEIAWMEKLYAEESHDGRE